MSSAPYAVGTKRPTLVGSEAMPRFERHEHIRRREQFQQVYKHGARIYGGYSALFILPNKLPFGRLGIAATKKLGGSVERNRAKRLIREVFRRNKIASGFDVVVVPNRRLLDATLTALEAEYRHNLERHLLHER